jgi:PIN domain nuclease of toxin-antitoxin system
LSVILLDTHVLAWSVLDSKRLSALARREIAGSDAIWICAISLYEIGQKIRIGKWPAMAPHLPALRELVGSRIGRWRATDDAIALRAALLDWPHRDPFDRLIAATAIELDVPLISADAQFDGLRQISGWRGRIW